MQLLFTEISHDIKISVQPVFVESDSDVIRKKFIYAYYVMIENLGNKPVKLLSRYWKIMDSTGEVNEVEGDGVIGRQPRIEPGSSYRYNSYCVLKSMKGSMKGFYTMEKDNGDYIKVRIPEFLLRSHLLN